MDSNNFFNVIQQSFRTALGATSAVIETIQDSTKREQTLSELREEWQTKVKEWEEKGEITEQEARRMMDNIFQKNKDNGENINVNNDNVTDVSSSSTNHVREIQELTQSIINLRTELEKANS